MQLWHSFIPNEFCWCEFEFEWKLELVLGFGVCFCPFLHPLNVMKLHEISAFKQFKSQLLCCAESSRLLDDVRVIYTYNTFPRGCHERHITSLITH